MFGRWRLSSGSARNVLCFKRVFINKTPTGYRHYRVAFVRTAVFCFRSCSPDAHRDRVHCKGEKTTIGRIDSNCSFSWTDPRKTPGFSPNGKVPPPGFSPTEKFLHARQSSNTLGPDPRILMRFGGVKGLQSELASGCQLSIWK
jgi:hypothetical protein